MGERGSYQVWEVPSRDARLLPSHLAEQPQNLHVQPYQRNQQAERGVPLHVARSTLSYARFDQVEGVSDREREAAWRRIRAAARKYGVEIKVRGWRQLMKGGKTGRRS